jgi:dihydrofolate synthase/folylpolyglutamate synthase
MLNTKDITGYMAPLAAHADHLHAVTIPDAPATVPAEDTAAAAVKVGMTASKADNVAQALEQIAQSDPTARILICGSLYLAGAVLRDNGA